LYSSSIMKQRNIGKAGEKDNIDAANAEDPNIYLGSGSVS